MDKIEIDLKQKVAIKTIAPKVEGTKLVYEKGVSVSGGVLKL